MIIHNINDLIKYGIHVHGGSSIPGIGTIKINRIPASYTIDRKKLSSPNSTLSYFNQELEEFSILQYAESCGIDSFQVKFWSEEMVRMLTVSDATLFIPEVGTLSKNESGLVFISDVSINWNAYSHWPELDIHPLSNPKTSYEFAVSQPKELTYAWKQKQNNSSSWLFPGIILLLVFLFLGIKTCLPDYPKSVQTQKNEETNLIQNDSIESKDLNITTQPNENQTINIKTTKETLVEDFDSNEIHSVSKTDANNRSSNVKPCTYIVGAFLKTQNAENLHRSLRSKGYETVLLKHDSFMRVGIVLPCDKDLKVPENILNSFPDVWLLEE